VVTSTGITRRLATSTAAAACVLLLCGCGGEDAVNGFAGGTKSKDKQPIPSAIQASPQPGAPTPVPGAEAPSAPAAGMQEPAVAGTGTDDEAASKDAGLRSHSNEYRATGRRDPFASLIGSDMRSDLVDLSVVKLVGLVTSGDRPFAVVEDSEGVTWVLRKGDRVKNGRVVRVSEDGLVCSQTVLGYTTTVQLKLENGKGVQNG